MHIKIRIPAYVLAISSRYPIGEYQWCVTGDCSLYDLSYWQRERENNPGLRLVTDIENAVTKRAETISFWF